MTISLGSRPEGIQRDVETEARTVEALAAEVTTLKRKPTLAEKAQTSVPEAEVQRSYLAVWRGKICRSRRARPRWGLRQESSLYLPLRRRPFYPLN